MEGIATSLLDGVAASGPSLLFALTFLETCFITGLVVPAGVALLFGAALSGAGTLSLPAVVGSAVAGAALGDSVGFWVGRKGDASWRRSRWLSGALNARRRQRMDRMLAGSPFVSVSLARVVSFVRTVMPLAAGGSGLSYGRFLLFDALGIALWATLYVGLGWFAGEHGRSVNGVLAVIGLVVFAAAVQMVLERSESGPPKARRVALTGNVGAGKSTVGKLWRGEGVPVASSDEFARAASAIGSEGLDEIARAFGTEAVQADGSLDRAWLRAQVFGDEAARERLEAILHPRIKALREAWEAEQEDAGERLLVTEIPLLFETGTETEFDTVVLVDAPEAERLERLVETRGLTPEVAQRIIDAQLPSSQKRPLSDIVIDNDADLDTLRRRSQDALTQLREGS